MKRKDGAQGNVIVRCLVLKPGAALGFAKKTGRDLAASNESSRYRVFDGYIIRATKQPSGDVIVIIMELPGIWVFGAQFSQDQHDNLPDGFIDGFTAASLFYDIGGFSKALKAPLPSDPVPEFDIAKISAQTGQKLFATEGAENGEVISSSPGIVLAHGNMLTRTKFYRAMAGNDFGSKCGVICTAFNGTVAKKPSVLEEGEIYTEPAAKGIANYLTFVMDDNFAAQAFGDDIRFGIPKRQNHPTPHVPDNAVENPPLSFMLKNKITGKRTDMAVISPIVKTHVPPENPDSKRYDISQLYGHAVIIADVAPTEEQKNSDSNEFPAIIKASSRQLLTDYASLVSPGQVYIARTQVLEDEELIPGEWDTNMYFDNWIHQLSAAVIEAKHSVAPDPLPITPYGERPAYYGDTKILVATVTVHDFCDQEPVSDYSEGRLVSMRANIYTQVCTTLHTYTLLDGGIEHEETMLDSYSALITNKLTLVDGGDPDDPLDYLDLYPESLVQNEGSGDGAVSFQRGLSAENAEQKAYYFYAPTGDGIPAVVITLNEWKWDETFREPAAEYIESAVEGEESMLVLGIGGFGADFEGSQITESANFVMIYAGGETVTYDLGDHSPPRPILKGLTFAQFREKNPAFAYNTSIGGDEDRTVSFRESSGDFVNRYKPFRNKDQWIHDTPSADDNSGKRRTRRRVVDMPQASISQKIHAHCGAGVMAILVTENNLSGASCSWYVSMARESTGELLYRGGNIFAGSKLGAALPLESANWLSLSLIQPMKKDSSGNITQEAILLCSVQTPRVVFSGARAVGGEDDAKNIHLYQGRLYSQTMKNTVSESRHIDTYSEQRISRDSGLTWQTFIKDIPGDGFYMGSAIRPEELTR